MESKVCLLGASLETGNRGVSALSISLIENVLERQPEARVFLVISHHQAPDRQIRIGDRSITISSLNWRCSPRANPHEHILVILSLAALYRLIPLAAWRQWILRSNRMLETLQSAAFVGDIHGGDSFSDLYGKRRFLLGCLPLVCLLLLGKEYTMLPQTYGPFASELARRFAQRILSRAARVLSRDHASLDEVRSLLGSSAARQQIEFCPDVAFNLRPRPATGVRLDSQAALSQLPQPIGFNVNGLLYHGGLASHDQFNLKLDYQEFVKELALALLTQFTAPLLLVPHTYSQEAAQENDQAACLAVKRSLPDSLRHRAHIVITEHDSNELKWIVGHCDFFIGSRMHACIAALSQGIPAIGLAYSKKFAGVYQSIGADHLVVDARQLDAAAALGTITEAYVHRETARAALRPNLVAAQARIKRIFDQLLANRAD